MEPIKVMDTDLWLTADSDQWIIGKKRIRVDKETGDEKEYIEGELYPARLESALHYLSDYVLRTSVDFHSIPARIEEFKIWVKENLNFK